MTPFLDRLDQQARTLTAETRDLDMRLARLRSAASAERISTRRSFLQAQMRGLLRTIAEKKAALAALQQQRAAWIAKHPAVTPPLTWPKTMPKSAAVAPLLRAGGAKAVPLPPTPAQIQADPFRAGLTLALAPRALRFYEEQVRSCRNPALCAYYRQRLTYAQSVLRAAAPGRRTRQDLQAEVTRLQRLAAAAQARKDYAMNLRLRQQIERMEQQMRVSAVATAWSPTAPESYVAPADGAPPSADTALTFQQARTAALAPVTDAARAVEDGSAAEDGAANPADPGAAAEDATATGIEEKPWYVRHALPLALAAAAGIGLAMFGKKGKGAGHFKLLRHGRASSHSTHHAAK